MGAGGFRKAPAFRKAGEMAAGSSRVCCFCLGATVCSPDGDPSRPCRSQRLLAVLILKELSG